MKYNFVFRKQLTLILTRFNKHNNMYKCEQNIYKPLIFNRTNRRKRIHHYSLLYTQTNSTRSIKLIKRREHQSFISHNRLKSRIKLNGYKKDSQVR